MSYIVGGNIQAEDYNRFSNRIKQILTDLNSGAITVDNGIDVGYGKTSDIATLDAGEIITNEQWAELIDTMKLVGVHQGTETTPPMPTVNPDTGDIVEVYNSPITFQALLDLLYANRMNVDPTEATVVNKLDQTYSTPWSDLLEFRFEVDFGSWDSLRYFFNLGGTIDLTGDYSSTATPVEQQMRLLLQAASPIKIGPFDTVPDSGLNQQPDVGVYHLYSSFPEYTTIYRQSFNGGAWNNRGMKIEAKLIDQPGTSGQVAFRVTMIDTDGDQKTGDLNYVITATVPAGVIPYTGIVDVTFDAWEGIDTPLPVVTAVTPASGTRLGGNTVVISGINFTGITGVMFGALPASGYLVVNDTTINAVPPGGTTGQVVPIVVYASGGQSNNNITYTYTEPVAPTGIIATGGIIEDRVIGWRCYRIHTFNASGVFDVINKGTYGGGVEYLIVGGGGGGGGPPVGSAGAGGGGGGGGAFGGSLSVSQQAYSITVGAGGQVNGNGGASAAFGITVPGGGRGGRYPVIAGGAGASGGGGGQGGQNHRDTTPDYVYGGAGTPGWGFGGGTAIVAPGLEASGGGGGGGATGAGGNTIAGRYSQPYPSPYNFYNAYIDGGPGGAGTVSNIYGYPISISGGGGGAGCNSTADGRPYGWPSSYFVRTPNGAAGAAGGAYINGIFVRSGGAGAVGRGAAENAVPNRGGGGGGGSVLGTGVGGAGLVVTKYLKCQPPAYDFDKPFVSARSLPSAVRFPASAVTQTHQVLSIGGIINGTSYTNGTVTNLVNSYNPTTNNWTAVANMPAALHSHSAQRMLDGKIYVWGGQSAVPALSASGYIYDPVADSWAAGTSFPFAVAGAASARFANGDIISIGGRTQPDSVTNFLTTNMVYIYRAGTGIWERVADCPVTSNAGAATVMPNGNVAFVYRTGFYVYNPTTNAWSQGPNLPAGRFAAGVVCTPEGYVGVYGGSEQTNVPTSTLYVYNPCCNAWGSATSLPITVYGGQAQISDNGGNVYIFGGVSTGGINVPNLYKQELRVIPAFTPIAATGGAITEYTIGAITYRVHTFLSSGTFTVSSLGTSGGTVEYLLVGGGGGGGWTTDEASGAGGGGGGGGVITGTTNLSASSYAVTVGAGGAPNTNGGDTSIFGAVAKGGGYGGTYSSSSPATSTPGSGGSGGGAGQSWPDVSVDGGNTVATQGSEGGSTETGTGVGDEFNGGAGGGGAGATGESVIRQTAGGDGGAGIANSLRTGTTAYYAGGGGGAGANAASSPGGAGGLGGGGAGAVHSSSGTPAASDAVAGTANTGGGGGGGNGNLGDADAASGGSGIVVIRYKIAE